MTLDLSAGSSPPDPPDRPAPSDRRAYPDAGRDRPAEAAGDGIGAGREVRPGNGRTDGLDDGSAGADGDGAADGVVGAEGDGAADAVVDEIAEVARQLKPKLRGWLHAGVTPLAVVAGILLLGAARTPAGVVGGAVFLAASVLLFGTSAIYHRFSWGDRGNAVLRRLDHSNIYVFIAATYTPFGLLLLSGRSRITLLAVVWGAALLGLVFRTCWLNAPRWLYTALYLLVGWGAMFWLPSFLRTGGIAICTLILAGGLFYTAGATVYALKRPDPSPRWFGFHEIFHACTIAAFTLHYTAIFLVTSRA